MGYNVFCDKKVLRSPIGPPLKLLKNTNFCIEKGTHAILVIAVTIFKLQKQVLYLKYHKNYSKITDKPLNTDIKFFFCILHKCDFLGALLRYEDWYQKILLLKKVLEFNFILVQTPKMLKKWIFNLFTIDQKCG